MSCKHGNTKAEVSYYSFLIEDAREDLESASTENEREMLRRNIARYQRELQAIADWCALFER